METNETVYLKDGRKANYELKLDNNKHLVKVYTVYYGYEQEEYEDLGETIIVEEVFKKEPVQIVSEKIKQLKEEKLKLIKEVQELNVSKIELTNYITQKTSFKKHIINKKEFMNAKSLAFFTSRELLPTILEKDKMRGLKISLHLSIFNNKERIKNITDPSKISNNLWLRVDDKYLTKELIVYKNEIIDKEQKSKKAKKLAEIEKLKKELSVLEKA